MSTQETVSAVISYMLHNYFEEHIEKYVLLTFGSVPQCITTRT